MYKTIIFDLFDTLIERKMETKIYKRIYHDLKLNEEEIKKAERYFLTQNFRNLKGYMSFLSRKFDKIALNSKIYEDEINSEINSFRLFPESKEVLEKLKKRVRIGVISNINSIHKRIIKKQN